MNTIDAIKLIDFFDTLNEKQISFLQSISTIRRFSEDTIVYYEDDIDYSLHFLVEGTIKIYKIDKYDNEIFLYYIYKNNMISEFTSIDDTSIYCFSNASFMQEGTILSINFQQFKKEFIDTGVLTQKFIKEILNKTHQLQCILNRELVFDATAKVSFMLSNDLAMFNQLKRTEVSFMLHIQPETLSRVLKKLLRSDIINITGTKIVIVDADQLCSIFRGIGK
ncbi:MAG: Crp/Fnr family transcriptional regulator [Arcobacteraceae bacterium]|nr:Crp/Fnr family transcriptional regulator [Arcobacteraceae bacterium]